MESRLEKKASKYQHRCRFCLKGTSEFAVNIFKDENGRSLAKEAKAFLPFKIRNIRLWPRRACLDCVELVMEMIKFHKLATKTNDYLSRKLAWTISSTSCDAAIVIDDDEDADQKAVKQEKVVKGTPTETPKMKQQRDRDKSHSIDGETILESKTEPLTTQGTELKEEKDCPIEESPNLDQEAEENNVEFDCIVESEDINPELDNLMEYVEDDGVESDEWELSEDPEMEMEMPPEKKDRFKPYSRVASEKSRAVAQRRVERRLERRGVRVQTSRVRANWFTPLTEEEQKLEAIMLDLKLFECRLCGEDMQTLFGLSAHLKANHSDRRLPYEICCKQRPPFSPTLLYDHIRFHLDDSAFKCDECDYRGSSRSRLNAHKYVMHTPVVAPKCVCDICGAGFKLKSRLASHYAKIHSGPKVCKYCNRELTTVVGLRNHILKEHENVVNFLCDLCGKGFPSNGWLNIHIADHGGPHGGRRKKKPKKVREPEPSTSPLRVFDEGYFKC